MLPPTAPRGIVVPAVRIFNHAIGHFSQWGKVLSKPNFSVMFREVFYAQTGGDERSLNIIRWILRIRLKSFSLVFFASHLVLLVFLLFLLLRDDDLSDCDDDFASSSLSLDVIIARV